MKKRLFFLICLLITFFSSCTLAPKYSRPDAPVPANWPTGTSYDESKYSVVSSNPSKLSWKEFFTYNRLKKIIEISLNNNRDMRLASLNVEKVRNLYGIQRAELFPTVNAVGIGNKQGVPKDLSMTGESMTTEQYGINLGIASWEIDLFGRIRSLQNRALEEYLSTEQAMRGAQIALVTEVSRAYLTLAADRENLKLSESTLKAQREAYDLVQKLDEIGLGAKLDIRRVQTQVDTARENVIRFRQLVAQDKNALDLLAGSLVPEELLPEDIEKVTPPKEIYPGLSSTALLNRPDIMAAEHRLKGAYAFIGAARAAFFPRISLITSLGTASDELSNLFSSGSNTWNFAPQIAIPIFDARTWSAFRVSEAERKIALTQYEKTVQNAFREVADTLAVQVTVDQQIKAHESLLEASSEIYAISQERYRNGIDTYLSVLDAQRALFSAQQGLIALRFIKLTNHVRLYAVLGGGAE
ncbi:MAG: efflux transporter outer membrane subunit [Desulfobacterales bacterium]|nr:efflux transporter outer membrane subunit [Desulfobacterales bacterium]MBF0395907.1 efflux transporter outer membrane subunit [Desulfobacterales bacterium]